MLSAAAAQAGHPMVAALTGLGTAGLTGAVVAMAWNVHVRQFRFAELLARRQFIVAAGGEPGRGAEPERGAGLERGAAQAAPVNGRANGTAAVMIEGPDTVVAGEQARYRVRPVNGRTVVSWAVGGGAVSQAPDPAHAGELLLVADQPGDLMVSVRVREGMTDRRATKPVTALPDLTPAPPVSLRLFLHGWGLVAAAVLITGLTATLVELGQLPAEAFIALAATLAALLAVVTATGGRAAAHGRDPSVGMPMSPPASWTAGAPANGRQPGESPTSSHQPA